MRSIGKILFVVGVITLSISNAAAQNAEQVLYSFAGTPDGSLPSSGLVFDASGNLYGTTQQGGTYGYGTIFKLAQAEGGGWTESVLYSFTGATDGAGPVSNLIFDASGNLYGTTAYGGEYGDGTAFELVYNSGWTLSTLWSFGGENEGGSDGILPEGGLTFDQTGNLYGTCDSGGLYNAGTVFELTPHEGGVWTENILHNFEGTDGARPWAGVTLDADGNIYGTALYDGPGETGGGIVFKLSSEGFTVIHDFNKGGGGGPFGGVIFDKAGNLYGTTYGEGSCAATVYKLAPPTTGTLWKLSVLKTFDGADGCQIYGPVGMDSEGNLYGATSGGGTHNYGTVFELTLSAKGTFALQTLYNFEGGTTDGADPEFVGVALDQSGNIYGTTYAGGASGYGTVFEVKGTRYESFTPATVSFAPELDGQTSKATKIKFEYTGLTPLTLSALTPSSSNFIVNETGITTDPCNPGTTILAQDKFCYFNVEFAPGSAIGTITGNVTASFTGDPNSFSSLLLPLSGTATEVTITPGTLAFGSVLSGTKNETLTVKNVGSTILTFSGTPTITGTGSAQFAVLPYSASPSTSTCLNGSVSLSQNESCTFTVQFTSASSGISYTTYLNIADNGGASPQLEKMTATD